jgi:exodeoxyribonuclease V alpha subunit
VTLVGHAPTVSSGEYASSAWVAVREHGRQCRAKFVKIAPPTSLAGIERYLGSGMVKGVGPVYASRLVKAFGAEVFGVIEPPPGTVALGKRSTASRKNTSPTRSDDRMRR